MAAILHIETSTDVCSVGISREGSMIALRETAQPFRHVSNITLFIEACSRAACIRLEALDAVAVSRGPGSFTALRIGASVAKGLCFALDKPLLSIDSLQALASGARAGASARPAFYCSMIDARRMEVYLALFDPGLRRVAGPEAVVLDENVFAEHQRRGETILVTGNGAEKGRELWPDELVSVHPLACSARHMVQLAEEAYARQSWEDVAYFEPYYLKPPNITKPKKRL